MADDDHDDEKLPPGWADPNRRKYELNSKIMLTAIISLTVVVILVLLLHIYARYALRRQARRRALIHRLGLGAIIQDHSSNEPPKTGLDPCVIASLPSFVFKQREAETPNNEDDDGATTSIECAVCLSMLEDEEMARLLPNCNHTFHAECIDEWLGSHSTCPICRTEVKPNLRAEPREPPAGASPSAPPLERGNSTLSWREGTASGGAGPSSSAKVSGGSSSRFGSFRRILSRDRSSRRVQPSERELEDLERQ